MKLIIYFLFTGLFIGLNFLQVQAQNTVYGTGAGTDGGANTRIGTYAGRISTGSYNSFLGYQIGYNNTSGYSNTLIDTFSGSSNTSGSYNTFPGLDSGKNNTTGKYNTCLDYYSGYSNTSGEKNVFIGHMAGFSETGSTKLYIDNNNDNDPLLYGDLVSNTLSIATKYTGDAYTLVVPGHVRATKYDVVSDERLKENVKSLNSVLEKVQQVNGVSYVLKEDAMTRQDSDGFLAQNIQEIFPELVTEDQGLLAVNYQGMIPVLVEALKILSAQKDSVAAVNMRMAQQIMAMHQRLDALEKTVVRQKSTSLDEIGATEYGLEQNHPNPFDQRTTIRYQVSEEAQQVGLLITNQQGVEVQRFDQLPAGAGEVQITAGSLTPGIYICSLFADGLLIGSQRMILTR